MIVPPDYRPASSAAGLPAGNLLVAAMIVSVIASHFLFFVIARLDRAIQ
jgi:hypothetical protein